MQRSSQSIASLAAALAKAQIELVNPEKSLIGDDRRQSAECAGATVPLCLAGQRSRYRAQDAGPA